MNNIPKKTISCIKGLLSTVTNEVIKKFQRNYNIMLHEEHITYYLTTEARDFLNTHKDDIKKALIEDIDYFLSMNGTGERYAVISNCDKNLVLDVSLHDRGVEGYKTKSDFSFIFSIPYLEKDYSNKILHTEYCRLINVQAKKIVGVNGILDVSTDTNPKKIIDPRFKNFYSICYYRFEENEGITKFKNLIFNSIPPNLKTNVFYSKVKKATTSVDVQKCLSLDNFLNELIEGKIGISDKEVIEEYTKMLNSNIISVSFVFKDNGRGLKDILERINSTKNSQFVKVGLQ